MEKTILDTKEKDNLAIKFYFDNGDQFFLQSIKYLALQRLKAELKAFLPNNPIMIKWNFMTILII